MEWKQTIRDTASKAAYEAQKLAKIAKMNLSILSEEEKIKKAQIELGKLCHQDHTNGTEANPAAYLVWHEKIETASTQIANLRSAIEDLKSDGTAAVHVVHEEDGPTAIFYAPSGAAQSEEADCCCGSECGCTDDSCCCNEDSCSCGEEQCDCGDDQWP